MLEVLRSLFEVVKLGKEGGKVYVEGSLRTRKWKDPNGVDREVTGIRADELQLL